MSRRPQPGGFADPAEALAEADAGASNGLVDAEVAGHAGEAGQLAALPLEDALPQRVAVG